MRLYLLKCLLITSASNEAISVSLKMCDQGAYYARCPIQTGKDSLLNWC